MVATLTVQFLDDAPNPRYASKDPTRKVYEYLYAGDIETVKENDLAVVYVDYTGLTGYKVVRILCVTPGRSVKAAKYAIGVVSEAGMKELVAKTERREKIMTTIEEVAKAKKKMAELKALAAEDSELQELFSQLENL